jgi:hypothetical protein
MQSCNHLARRLCFPRRTSKHLSTIQKGKTDAAKILGCRPSRDRGAVSGDGMLEL